MSDKFVFRLFNTIKRLIKKIFVFIFKLFCFIVKFFYYFNTFFYYYFLSIIEEVWFTKLNFFFHSEFYTSDLYGFFMLRISQSNNFINQKKKKINSPVTENLQYESPDEKINNKRLILIVTGYRNIVEDIWIFLLIKKKMVNLKFYLHIFFRHFLKHIQL